LSVSLDEPVRRYLEHALAAGATPGAGSRLTMSGRIKAGAWLPFTAIEELDGRSFSWRARVGRPGRSLAPGCAQCCWTSRESRFASPSFRSRGRRAATC
jgi:hypothetical protein